MVLDAQGGFWFRATNHQATRSENRVASSLGLTSGHNVVFKSARTNLPATDFENYKHGLESAPADLAQPTFFAVIGANHSDTSFSGGHESTGEVWHPDALRFAPQGRPKGSLTAENSTTGNDVTSVDVVHVRYLCVGCDALGDDGVGQIQPDCQGGFGGTLNLSHYLTDRRCAALYVQGDAGYQPCPCISG